MFIIVCIGGTMKITKAKEIVKLLADGVDPLTGEIYQLESPYQQPDIIRALHVALIGIDLLEKQENKQNKFPQNAGRTWSTEDNERLITDYDNGESIKDLAEKYERTVGAIRSRLVKLGRILP